MYNTYCLFVYCHSLLKLLLKKLILGIFFPLLISFTYITIFKYRRIYRRYYLICILFSVCNGLYWMSIISCFEYVSCFNQGLRIPSFSSINNNISIGANNTHINSNLNPALSAVLTTSIRKQEKIQLEKKNTDLLQFFSHIDFIPTVKHKIHTQKI